MKKSLAAIIVLLLLPLFLGCSKISGANGTVAPARPTILREASLASKWEVRHINLEAGAGEESPVLLKLADGDKVDGYFYLESGSNIDFRIVANSQVYKPTSDASGKGTTSDRFSFTATQAQGQSYTLLFKNPAVGGDKAKVKVFLEIIYPSTDSVFTLLESK